MQMSKWKNAISVCTSQSTEVQFYQLYQNSVRVLTLLEFINYKFAHKNKWNGEVCP